MVNPGPILWQEKKAIGLITFLHRLRYRLAQTGTSMDLDPDNIKTF